MANVSRPTPLSRRTVFNSVFAPGHLQPPQDKAQRSKDVTATRIRVREQLQDDGKRLLGIARHKYRYGSPVCNVSYSTDFSECPAMQSVPKPTRACRVKQFKHCYTLPSRQYVAEWQTLVGTNDVKKIFAHVVDVLLTEYVEWCYGGTYSDECRIHLKFWVENIFGPFVTDLMRLIDHGHEKRQPPAPPETAQVEIEKWNDMALTRLATLRTAELFDIVIDWPETAAGIDDLKSYTTSPASRSYVTSEFATVLQTRLLHPGASTIEILRVYINIIRAFGRLDARGVLLERVARKIRRYLREREDTVRVIVAGLLSEASTSQPVSKDPDKARRESHRKSESGQPSVNTMADANNLTELGTELQDRDANATKSMSWSSLDWDNMSWQPDPVDAAPDHLKSTLGATSTDVIGSIISLFESKDMVVKELQQSLAERLLLNRAEYEQEIAVVEHLKLQFGDSTLQACEVMLKDVLDSKRLDGIIRADQSLDSTADMQPIEEAQLHAKILSRLFWPSLPGADNDRQFRLPMAILEQRHRYEKGFENLKQTRKLNWNDNIGSVKVELAFEDGRTVSAEVLPSQASIIYAFQEPQDGLSDSGSTTATGITRSISSLAEQVEMEPILVRSVCMFWISRQVLIAHPTLRDTFSVLEYLPTSNLASATANGASPQGLSIVPAAQAQAAAAAAAAAAQREAEAAERKAKMSIYNQFITSMLTNGGPMPLPQINMMLGMVVPGGFPYSGEELRTFLEGMVRDEKLKVVSGGRFAIA